jgi:hypothetical protein
MKYGNSIRLTKAIVVTYSLVMVLTPSLGVTARAEAPVLNPMSTQISEVAMETLFPKPALIRFKDATEQLSDTELVDLLYAVGFQGKSLKTAWAVAKRESNGRPLAHNDNTSTGDNSYGIFQINMLGSLGEDRRAKYELTSNKDLFDPVTNLKIVYHMTNGGSDWSSWDIGSDAYNNGRNEPAYFKWLKKYPSEYSVDKQN